MSLLASVGKGLYLVLFDETGDFFDGLFELAFLIFDGVVIDIGMFQPLLRIFHALSDECLRYSVAFSYAGFQYGKWGGEHDGDNFREELFRRDDTLVVYFPDADAPALGDASYFLMGYAVEVIIVLLRPFEEFPLGDALFEVTPTDEIVGVTIGVSGTHGATRRRHDPFDRKMLLEPIDDGIFADTGWPGNDKEIFCIHR